MKDRYYECSKCHKITRHIWLSEREFAAMSGDNKVMVAGAAVFDALGGTMLMNNVTGVAHYKCSECGTICERNGDGTDITEWKDVSLFEKVMEKKFPWNK